MKEVPWVFHTPDGKRHSRNSKKTLMKRLCRQAGVKHFGFHGIRHHVASVVSDSGKANIRQIRDLLGHMRTSTTDTYLAGLKPGQDSVADILDAEQIKNTFPEKKEKIENG